MAATTIPAPARLYYTVGALLSFLERFDDLLFCIALYHFFHVCRERLRAYGKLQKVS